ncbi:hypothetical protein ABEV74_13150 [Paenibacillus cisolokensis]|uniref:hypothetical protein n=1 Tax=Paenibacillus cisolokensis TaxID=1658519 RepID=UPI003D27D81E
MKQKIYFLYDDSEELPRSISSVVGERRFGEIIHKKSTLASKMKKLVDDTGMAEFVHLKNYLDKQIILDKFKEENSNHIIVHFYSRSVVVDSESFNILMRKIVYTQFIHVDREIDPTMLIFTTFKDYNLYLTLKENNKRMVTKEDLGDNALLFSPNNFLLDISDIASFLNFFSGGFEARYFNQLVGDKYTLVKKSTDKLKIQKEHDFYHLIPNEMKPWFVMPYNFSLQHDYACYTMERLNIPDMALQWIHNSISIKDFGVFLDKIFDFITLRPSRKLEREEYLARFKDLYYQKVVDRMEKLKSTPNFSRLESYIINGTSFTLDALLNNYYELYNRLVKEIKNYKEVIGHGDLCFSNILYDKNTYMMKFIDTKGALEEKDLWMDPYYDLAKLSHSILGNYDFLNNELFVANINNSLNIEIMIKSEKLDEHQHLFLEKVSNSGFDIRIIRLCETSLFLSMLPLHIDNPRKVLAFVLNAIKIKEELERNV